MTETTSGIESIREGWDLNAFNRELPVEGGRVPPKRRAKLRELANASDDQLVPIRADDLRMLLAAAERPTEIGAHIEGTGVNAGVVYNATIDADGARHLRTVEVIATGDRADLRAFRIPVRLVEDLTRYVVAAREEAAEKEGCDPRDIFFLGWEANSDGRLDATELYSLVKRGVTASGIAGMYGRSESRVYQLLRAARRERPELDWPKATRGPTPKTTDGRSPSGRKEGNSNDDSND